MVIQTEDWQQQQLTDGQQLWEENAPSLSEELEGADHPVTEKLKQQTVAPSANFDGAEICWISWLGYEPPSNLEGADKWDNWHALNNGWPTETDEQKETSLSKWVLELFQGMRNFLSDKAQKICAAMGGQIVSIHSEEENTLVARLIDEDYMLCNGVNEPLAEAPKMDAMRWLYLSFIIGVHRKRNGRGGFVSTLEDGSQATFGNVAEHRGKDSKADYPWSAQEPSGTLNWNYNDEPAEECVQMWHPCGWWNDIQCDRANLAGVVCQKNAV
ncbi:hypothetical protein niasHT_027290 [Heterodera trifolii]|uniref:C-type lectin domain-containing protein n=1 Tax=Heterodera trifolii TaxID=157864 RepID=A0ABD2JTK3_9BILA